MIDIMWSLKCIFSPTFSLKCNGKPLRVHDETWRSAKKDSASEVYYSQRACSLIYMVEEPRIA